MTTTRVGRRAELTFKGNLKKTRYGWLRLTPAYSVRLVAEVLEEHAPEGATVLDPFCGTGTTALVCAELGLDCGTTDINPFLVWLAEAKSRRYGKDDLRAFREAAGEVRESFQHTGSPPWLPEIHNIDRWWDQGTQFALGHGVETINRLSENLPSASSDLLKVVFCRTVIDRAAVSFGHQSMSFRDADENEHPSLFPPKEAKDRVREVWDRHAKEVLRAARSKIGQEPRVHLCDARELRTHLPANRFSCVITSPPYPNRMSYIRELRPYMYWLGYLETGRDAGELDWLAIGGTWGRATSNLGTWESAHGVEAIPYPRFGDILAGIESESSLLSNYVHKYFDDMIPHVEGLFDVVAPGGTVHYVVGNSKFYDVVVPVEEIYAALFRDAGFIDATVETVRKRNSKKELYEYLVNARKPEGQ